QCSPRPSPCACCPRRAWRWRGRSAPPPRPPGSRWKRSSRCTSSSCRRRRWARSCRSVSGSAIPRVPAAPSPGRSPRTRLEASPARWSGHSCSCPASASGAACSCWRRSSPGWEPPSRPGLPRSSSPPSPPVLPRPLSPPAAPPPAPPAVAAPPLPFPWRASPDERVVLRRDGPTATVLVTEDARGARRLRINGQYALGGGDGLFLERREGLLPVLLHPAPRRLLHLGVGTGDTLRAAMTSPGLTADGVELVSSALDAAAFFSNQNGDVLHEPGVHLVADDARSFLLSSRERWDVIVVDLVLPWTQGAGALFSRDFYRLGLEHLAAGGVLCPWLPLRQLPVRVLRAV